MRPILKRVLGRHYQTALRLKTSPRISALKSGLGRLLYGGRMDTEIAVDLSGRIGMGALIFYALRLHALAEDTGRDARIVSTSPLYSSGEDIFARFFERPALPPGWKPLPALAVEHLVDAAMPAELSLERSSALFARHFVPQPWLRALCAERFDLSVHFRGTDKGFEYGNVAAATMFAELDAQFERGGAGRSVFLATDEPAFEAELRRRYPAARVSTYLLGTVDGDVPRHFSGLSPQDLAVEAIVNIFRLANAPLCVRTSSFLSAVSRVAEPRMRTRTINLVPVGSYPERQILEAERVA